MRILVTGGAGYVGAVLTPMLLDEGHEVVVLDNLRHGRRLPEHPALRLIVGDIRDRKAVGEAAAGCEVVVHLAAIVGYPSCLAAPELARTTNVDGTRILVEALSPGQFLLYASSGSNYGRIAGVCDERSPINPISLYAQTKAAAEELVLARGFATALRFATAFGASPRMRFDLLVNDFVRRAMREGELTVYEGHFRRTFVHVHDMARSFVQCLALREAMAGEVYNVGHEALNVTKAAVAELIRARVPFDLRYADTGEDPDARDYDVSYAKFRALGFDITRDLDDGIAEVMALVQTG